MLAYVAETATLLRDREAAELLYATLEPHARLFPVVARGGACIGSVQYFIAGLAQTLGRSDEAELRLRRAITENLRIGARPRATIALARLGELLARARRARTRPRDAARGRRAGGRARHAGLGAAVPAPPLGRAGRGGLSSRNERRVPQRSGS